METEDVTVTIRKAPLYGAMGLVLGVGLGFGLGRFTTNTTASAQIAPPGDAAPVDVDTTGRPSLGSDTAPVTLVEFTDYECPFCKHHFQETYDSILVEYGGRVRYVVRNFPLAIHGRAQKAAEGAECANDQGRFWKYHDLLFQRAPALGRDSLMAYAAHVGLDVAAFTKCLDSGEKAAVVARDSKDGAKYGVRGTPTFFINGRILIGAQPLEAFRPYIEDRP
jgi:protein-disulfide isomerase